MYMYIGWEILDDHSNVENLIRENLLYICIYQHLGYFVVEKFLTKKKITNKFFYDIYIIFPLFT